MMVMPTGHSGIDFKVELGFISRRALLTSNRIENWQERGTFGSFFQADFKGTSTVICLCPSLSKSHSEVVKQIYILRRTTTFWNLLCLWQDGLNGLNGLPAVKVVMVDNRNVIENAYWSPQPVRTIETEEQRRRRISLAAHTTQKREIAIPFPVQVITQ